MAKQDDYARYTVRIPQNLYAEIERAAEAANRSVNAEIVERLAYSVSTPAERVSEMENALEAMEGQLVVAERIISEAEEKIEAMSLGNAALSGIVRDHFSDLKKLMHQVLNYVDKIPIDLAIWAYDMTIIFSKNPKEDKRIERGYTSEAEIRRIIRQYNETYKENYIKEIKEKID